ncbi:MAG: hypothetical protein AAF081_18145, partial [Actinomycetota bacterium]
HLPLLEAQGNIGTPDEPPADPEFTECRLTPLGIAALNAERGELGPLPIALINGTMTSGGVHPPHDPTRVVAAIRAATGDATDAELVELVGPPTFPTSPIVEVDTARLAAGERVGLRQRAHLVHVGDEIMVTGLPLRSGPDRATDDLLGRLHRQPTVGVDHVRPNGLHDLIVTLTSDADPEQVIELMGELRELDRSDHVQLREPMAVAIRRIADGGRDLDHRLALIEAAART